MCRESQIKRNLKRPKPRHIIIKMTKVKDKENLKNSKRKALSRLQGNSPKTQPVSRQSLCREPKVMKSKDLQLRLLYPARPLFKMKGEIKSFQDEKKLKESITTKQILQEMFK